VDRQKRTDKNFLPLPYGIIAPSGIENILRRAHVLATKIIQNKVYIFILDNIVFLSDNNAVIIHNNVIIQNNVISCELGGEFV
jgi:hypothetical protein